MHRPKIPKNPKILRNYQARPWQSSKKSWDSWESWACAWILHFVHRDSWESWAPCRFGELSPSLKPQNLHRPKIPKIPDGQSAGFMHRPKIPKNPKIFRNYQARPWQSSKKSWDSWESWACAWILHFVHRDSWESWACAGLVSLLHLWSHKTCTCPRFPRIPMNKVQDSCTGPRFPRIPRFWRTIRQDPDKVPKNLGILGNLGPVHESCTLFIGILGNLGPVQVLWRSYVKLCCLFEKKCIFPVFFDGEPQNLCRGSSFSGRNFENGEPDSGFALLGVFLRTDDCNRNHFTYSVFKKHWYLQWFLHVPHFVRWRWRYICDTPPPAGRPWEGGWPYIYIVHTYIYIYTYLYMAIKQRYISYISLVSADRRCFAIPVRY